MTATTATLLEKVYGSFSPRSLEALLSSLCKDLRVKIRVRGKTSRNWIQIDLTGEDEFVALKLLDREVGLAPVSEREVRKFSALYGRVFDSEKATTELHVDIGVMEPRTCDAIIQVQRLQAQLADARNLSLQHITRLFCINDFMPLHVKIIADLDAEEGVWQAALSEAQLSKFSDWLRSNLDRLIVFGASRPEVEQAVERSGHFRDVLRIEKLGLCEQAILFKLGTDAIGIMPKLGPYLRHASLEPFSPRRIMEEMKLETC